jgi:hypothetical protein
LFVDEHGLLPTTRRFVGAVNASYPATGPFLSFEQLLTGSQYTALASLGLLCVIDPTNKFVAAKGRQGLPKRKGFPI